MLFKNSDKPKRASHTIIITLVVILIIIIIAMILINPSILAPELTGSNS
ncbi:MAG: hypothetical protein ACTSU4_13120 [Promethearchaeota archaeon]